MHEDYADRGTWQEQIMRLSRMRQSWIESILRHGIEPSEIAIEVYPEKEPVSETSWNWWFTFSVRGVAIDALAPQNLEHLLFEDLQGRYEDQVPVEEVPQYVVNRASSDR
jgi:hypothetical protein